MESQETLRMAHTNQGDLFRQFAMTPQEREEEKLLNVAKERPRSLKVIPKVKQSKFKKTINKINKLENKLFKPKFLLPKVKKLTSQQISSSLSSRRERTLNKIIASRGASQSAKDRARKLLGK